MLDDGQQISLLPEVVPPDDRPARGRQTSKGIGEGDIVEVDRKGRRFHALVEGLEQRASGRFELRLRPLDARTTYRTATVREVVGVWRRIPAA
ncbi:MAG TPA: hypothetical protein VFT50_03185 [Baekduia sp.]|nr:hypothetical protein [Baekduia sp.]